MATYDATTARALLERAIANTSKPALDDEAVDLLLQIAASEDGSYSTEALNSAAATGWGWKSGMLADQYNLGGGSGVYLTRSQWFEQCRQIQADFASGATSVDGSGIVSENAMIGDVITISSDFLGGTDDRYEGWT
ncbi:MAG TPA: hypothetical protein VFQ54_01210 [Thermomicrobiales bacterium]|nr:hypothetical protein [Thermomicrobiales bacterium]